MAGFDSPYVPGFDCHGLPIEIKVDEKLGRKKLEMPAAEFLRHCREYAQNVRRSADHSVRPARRFWPLGYALQHHVPRL